MVRCTCSETLGSWVTTTPVTPISLLAVCSAANTSADVAVSSSPVGSSAKSTSGSLARATAIGDPLLLAARHLRRAPVAAVRHAEHLQQLVDPLFPAPARAAPRTSSASARSRRR